MGLQRSWFALVTIHDYAYYELTLTSWQWARLVAAMLARARRMVCMIRSAGAQWAEVTRPRYASVVGAWAARDLAAVPALELLAGARAIVEAAASHYVSIQLVLAAVNASESLFTAFYGRFIKRSSDPSATAFLLGFDSLPIQAEKSLYDLAAWARLQVELAGYLARESGRDIAAARESPSAPIADAESWREFTARLADHLNRFGHAIYDLDFAKSVPTEDPASLLETLKYFVSGQGRDPYQRQAAATAAREQAAASVLARLRGPRLRLFRSLLGWAQRCAPLREDTLADVGLGWPVLRRILREAGRRLAAAGALAEQDDVYWLKREELEEEARAIDAGQSAHDHRCAIDQRRADWKREQSVTPPVALPVKDGARMFGLDVSRFMPARSSQTEGGVIRGFGASPGRVTGAACVIHGPEEFDRMKPGDILVANITTPAWTPLFAMASGIVTDVGGLLSHSSILAREYGVPAVLGTGVATHRIRGGQHISVDGDGGVVTLSG
jgi:phosphohistidine swiveling domain-containing protein